MVGTFWRPRALALALAAVVLAFAALVIRTASASHDDCVLSSTAPSSYLGTAVISSGSVDCATRKSVLRFSVAMTSERTCHKAATCWSYAFDNDPAGDQRYCSTVSARVGSHSLAPVTRCEEEVSP
jgi:hypothetical protein